jgi:3-deoxy-D-manno-octulosonate 8-phosphate phosphatase (KDO 8-P phosphatase)
MSADPLAHVPEDVVRRLAGVRLVALDVDGVLTDGRVTYLGEPPVEAQSFDVKDGAGLVALRACGVSVVWITGRGCPATELRARELGAKLVSGVQDKGAALAQAQAEFDAGAEATVAMGDDLADLAMAEGAGVFAAPADAVPEVLARADWVTTAPGGRGAVRELCVALLAARGSWGGAADDTRG